MGSIYRTLKEFEDSGIVIRHQFDSIGTVYESNTGADHDHTVCVVCGKIREFYKTEFDSLRKEVVSESKGRLIKHTQTPICGVRGLSINHAAENWLGL